MINKKLLLFLIICGLYSLQIRDKNLEEFHKSTLIMEHNFIILIFLPSALFIALNMSSLHLKLHNKGEWLNAKIEWFKRWHGLCYIARTFPNGFGLKLLTQLFMSLTVFILDPEQKLLHMRYGLESNQTSSISEPLVASVTFCGTANT